MAVYLEIVDVYAREILDSRGNPTVEAEVNVKDGEHVFTGRASVPSGASTGEHEAKELRDTDSGRYHGKGVHQAVVNVNDRIKAVLLGKDAANQVLIDQILNCTDGTENMCKGIESAITPLSGRSIRNPDANADDEYFEWGASCRQHGGFSGVYDRAGGGTG